MQTWEYRQIHVLLSQHGHVPHTFLEMLERLGTEGWELVSVVAMGEVLTGYLKRPGVPAEGGAGSK